MRIVIALGGNALLQRGQPMTAENQRANIRVAAECIAAVAPGNEIVVAHGNGPQVGLLALQAAAYHDVAPYPLDVLGAQTEAMIGYVIEQELGNLLPAEQPLATLLTMIEVDRDDPAFAHPTKPIGPVYDRDTAERLKAASGWAIAADGDKFRRVVASPKPKRIFEIRPIRSLVEQGTIVICAGGGGIPTMYDENGNCMASRPSSTRTSPRLCSPNNSTPTCSSSPPTSTVSTPAGAPRTRRGWAGSLPTSSPASICLRDRWAQKSKRHAASRATPATKPSSER